MVYKVSRNLSRFSLMASIALALGLTGCGGSSGGSNVDQGVTGITGVQLDGVASKGIVKAGLITAEELDVKGVVIGVIGTTITAADGSYSLALANNYRGGPIQVTVTTDSNSQMKCDAPVGCGHEV